ncbi:hypothetical protein BC941DRAFT_407895 [Chlamydoabsidia padenii]|nr:hypothetical protein BC941DRAFT_407895 [Chlamydoabsidia padenii]
MSLLSIDNFIVVLCSFKLIIFGITSAVLKVAIYLSVTAAIIVIVTIVIIIVISIIVILIVYLLRCKAVLSCW